MIGFLLIILGVLWVPLGILIIGKFIGESPSTNVRLSSTLADNKADLSSIDKLSVIDYRQNTLEISLQGSTSLPNSSMVDAIVDETTSIENLVIASSSSNANEFEDTVENPTAIDALNQEAYAHSCPTGAPKSIEVELINAYDENEV